MADENKLNLLLALLNDASNEMRYRSQAEHLYTAAAVAGFGATTWGVAGLPSDSGREVLVAAAFGVLILAGVVIYKIWDEHQRYGRTKAQRAGICEKIEALDELKSIIPDALLKKEAGPGYKGSIWIVAAAAFASIIFCLAKLIC